MPKPRPQPTMKVGEPFVVPQVAIPEPAALIGLTTGKQYAVMGDNPNGPEMISQPQDGGLQVTPPLGGKPKRPMMGMGGGVSMAGGGYLDFDPQVQTKRARLLGQGLDYDDDLDLNEAQMGRFPQRRAVMGLQRAQQQQEINATGAKRRATLGMIDAATDIADQSRVAQLEQARGSTDYRYRAAGVALPTEVEQATGDTSQITSPFARTKLMTRAQMLLRDEKNRAALSDLDITAGRQSLESAKLDYEESGLGVEEMRLRNAGATTRRKRAMLGAEENELPPFQGAQMYTYPDGRQKWLTPGEADEAKWEEQYDLQNKRIPRNYAQNQARSQYGTQQDAQGSQLAAYKDDDFVRALVPAVPGDPRNLDPSQASETVIANQIRAELLRRYRVQGMPEAAARQKAESDVQQYLAAAKKAREAAAGSGGYSYGAAPGPPAASGGGFSMGR